MSNPKKEMPCNPDHPGFAASYEHTDRDTGESFSAPFPVAVFGIRDEFFGVGQVIGNIGENPVIEVEDTDNGRQCYVMGYESWWAAPVPDEVVNGMTSGRLVVESVAAYRQRQDDYWETVHLADRIILEESGIDPDSLEE